MNGNLIGVKPLESEGLACLRTWAYISVETSFKSKADYSYFVQEKTLRLMLGGNGCMINFLRKLFCIHAFEYEADINQ